MTTARRRIPCFLCNTNWRVPSAFIEIGRYGATIAGILPVIFLDGLAPRFRCLRLILGPQRTEPRVLLAGLAAYYDDDCQKHAAVRGGGAPGMLLMATRFHIFAVRRSDIASRQDDGLAHAAVQCIADTGAARWCFAYAASSISDWLDYSNDGAYAADLPSRAKCFSLATNFP